MSYVPAYPNEHLTRQSDLIPSEILDEPITVIGAGAIGSLAVLTLAKMGFNNISVWDYDQIEPVNLNCQFYRFDDVGKPKVEALKDLIRDFTNIEIEARNEQYKEGKFKGIVISAVDSMAVRKLIWDNHKELSPSTKLIIDPRMGAEVGLCYAMKPMSPTDVTSYEKTLYTDEDGVQERCTAKSTMYTALAISSHVAKIVKDFLVPGEGDDKRKYSRIMEWNIGLNVQKTYPAKDEG